MKKWLLHIWMMGVLGMLAASCSQEDDGLDPVVEKQKVMLRFTIALDEPKSASRSWDGYDDEDTGVADKELGSINENKINNVHALLYDLNGILIGKLNNAMPEVVSGSTNQHVYTVVGSIEVDADKVADLDFKLMVFANCNLPADLSNPSNLVFTNPNTTNGNGIPMWGIATYTGVDLSNSLTVDTAYELTNTTSNQDPVYMLRSMAKIEVSLEAETAKTYSLTGATLNKVMNSGFVMPKLRLPDTTTDLTSTKQLGIDEVFNPIASDGNNVLTTGQETSFTKNEGNDATATADDSFIIYVPEYEVGSSEAPLISLGLQDSNGNAVYKDATNQTPYSFRHGLYEEGSFNANADVIRNHWYKYEISIKNGVDLEVLISIYNWIYTLKEVSTTLNPEGEGL